MNTFILAGVKGDSSSVHLTLAAVPRVPAANQKVWALRMHRAGELKLISLSDRRRVEHRL